MYFRLLIKLSDGFEKARVSNYYHLVYIMLLDDVVMFFGRLLFRNVKVVWRQTKT